MSCESEFFFFFNLHESREREDCDGACSFPTSVHIVVNKTIICQDSFIVLCAGCMYVLLLYTAESDTEE